jgi:hypothetical protein
MAERCFDMRIGVAFLGALAIAAAAVRDVPAQQTAPQFGGTYATLDARRQQLVVNWVARFNSMTGQKVEAGLFYDDIVAFSTKTTFEAVTNALMQSSLTDANGTSLGDALSLVERIDAVHGKIPGERGDHQFRMYVRLTPTAIDTLRRSNQFLRDSDNSVYHKGYPQSYREQGGTPSIQFSVALDNRRADIDVDYRSSSFPAALFNGHLTAANSDVRAGNNYDRHVNRWAGFQNWWRGFLGTSVGNEADTPDRTGPLTLPAAPRAGDKAIDVMVNDFLNAWLIEGNVLAAMGYISDRSYGCLADAGIAPANMDRGMAPYQLMINLKAARDALGAHTSLEGLTTGVRLANPTLKVVRQSHHAQFVIYSVPDDVVEAFECQNPLPTLEVTPARRRYGNYFGTIFYVGGRKNTTVALLWARDNDYWKIVAWQTGFETRVPPQPVAPEVKIVRAAADRSLVDAAHDFLESWFIRKDYGSTSQYLSERSYACYNLMRDPEQPEATSTADAALKIRAAIERAGQEAGTAAGLDQLLSSVEPVHPAVHLLYHRYARTFALTSLPTALAEAMDCSARAKGQQFTGVTASDSDYGTAFGMNVRVQAAGGEAPVLRLLWLKENGKWRIAAYDVEAP